MDPKKTVEFRQLLLNYTQTIPDQDATTLLDAVEKMEFWIEQYVNAEVSRALQPYIKFSAKKIE